MSRGPRLVAETNPLPHVLSTVVDVPVQSITDGVSEGSSTPVKTGHILLRSDASVQRQVLTCVPDDIVVTSHHGLSLEMALFPFLFFHGTGHYDGSMTLKNYMKMRMLMSFSVFTLFKPYLLVMFQVYQAVILATQVRSLVLSKSLHDYSKQHPEASPEDAMRNAIKWTIPPTVEGSPGYHRTQLQDLLCRVEEWGVPDLFMTLTADETSQLRFEEINGLDAFLERFGASLNWQDAPVECSRLFLGRYKAFMKEWIDGPESAQILGRVLHHITRLEVQHRGSLHVHVLLWIHEDDIERVANEIIAYVPAIWNPTAEAFVPPSPGSDPLRYKLYKIIMRKHMHKCTPWAGKADGCRDDKGRCKMLFPFDVSPSVNTTFDPKIMRYVYCRLRHCDRNVVPYHPTLALVWNASTNLQRITGTAWSIYVLKYSMKSEPIGKLDLGPEVAARLHLQDVPLDTLRLISNVVCAKPVSPAEAAVLMLQENLISVSAKGKVFYVCSTMPTQRSFLLRSNRPCTHPIDKYVQRPEALGDVTFMCYFKEYTIEAKRCNAGDYVGEDMAGKHVYRLRDRRLVRFTDYSPSSNSEGFFYQLLLSHVPFAIEADLITEGNNAEAPYMYECIIRGVFNTADELEHHVNEYARLHLYDAQYRVQLYESLTASLQGITHGPLSEAFVFDASALGGPREVARAPHQSWIEDLAPFDTAELSDEQSHVMDAILADPHGLHAISGVPGSGKTFLIKCIARAMSRENRVVRVSATTGAAAARLGPFATTCHSSFSLPINDDYVPSLARTNPRFEEIIGTDVFIIDEMSMLTAQNLDLILRRIYEAVKFVHPEATQHDFMQHKCVILVGDHGQLPAVCRCRLPHGEMCMACHFSKARPWALVKKHRLGRSIRQAGDAEYASFLDTIRESTPSPEVCHEVFGDRKVALPEAMDLAENGVPVLTSHLEDAATYNREVLDRLFTYTKRSLRMSTNASGVTDMTEWLHKDGFETIEEVAVGAKVMLLKNVACKKGLVNGATGEVIALKERAGDIYRIDVRLDGAGDMVHSILRSLYHRTYHDGKCYYKATFPMQLGYSYTIHKCQGATLADGAIVHIRKSFAPGMAYVALSRVPMR